MAKVIDKRPDGGVLIEVPAEDASGLEVGSDVEVRAAGNGELGGWPEPFGALAGKLPALGIDDVKAARRQTLLGKSR
jgi:hypothetical protein